MTKKREYSLHSIIINNVFLQYMWDVICVRKYVLLFILFYSFFLKKNNVFPYTILNYLKDFKKGKFLKKYNLCV